jgi:hypothetical protein
MITHLQTRKASRDLSLCPGWSDWALPTLRGAIKALDTCILENANCRGTDLEDARAERRGLVSFLRSLATEAQASWSTTLPGVAPEDVAAEYMPDMSDRQKILDSFSPYEGQSPILATPPTPAVKPIPEAPTFNPFGQPASPVLKP